MGRMLRNVDDLMTPAWQQTLASLPDTGGIDAAAIRLAWKYAEALDRAAILAAEADTFVAGDEDERLRHLIVKIEAVKVLESLGPKLLAVLVELKATPRARAKDVQAPTTGRPSKLEGLRGGRAG